MSLVPCPECGAQVSTRAAFCPSCGGPPPTTSAGRERLKDLLLVLFIVAVVAGSIWITIEMTIGRAEVVRLYDKALGRRVELTGEAVTVPQDEFRGVLFAVPYAGEVTLEITASAEQSVDVHLIDGADLLRLAGAKPPFAAHKLSHYPAFEATAAPSTKLHDQLKPGSYVVVLEHSKRGSPASEVRVVARLVP